MTIYNPYLVNPKLLVKKLTENAVLPRYSMEGDKGLDLVATSKTIDPNLHQLTFGTSIGVKIPSGYVGLLLPRSSIYKTGLSLANSCGVIDENYTGELMFKFNILNPGDVTYQIGDRIGQLVIVESPKFDLIETEELPITNRGSQGWGSSGK